MCQMERNFLHEYIDGSLDPLQKIILEEHLRTCVDCRQELNGLKIIDWDLHKLYQEEVGIPSDLPELRQRVLRGCFTEQADQEQSAKAITPADIWNIQVATFNNSLKFITLLSSLARKEKPEAARPKKQTSFLRKIIGL